MEFLIGKLSDSLRKPAHKPWKEEDPHSTHRHPGNQGVTILLWSGGDNRGGHAGSQRKPFPRLHPMNFSPACLELFGHGGSSVARRQSRLFHGNLTNDLRKPPEMRGIGLRDQDAPNGVGSA